MPPPEREEGLPRCVEGERGGPAPSQEKAPHHARDAEPSSASSWPGARSLPTEGHYNPIRTPAVNGQTHALLVPTSLSFVNAMSPCGLSSRSTRVPSR